jgi:hypothetical protein
LLQAVLTSAARHLGGSSARHSKEDDVKDCLNLMMLDVSTKVGLLQKGENDDQPLDFGMPTMARHVWTMT